MLDEATKAEIAKHFEERDDGFAARQELAIRDRIEGKLQEIEDRRRNRFQFLTAIGGFSLIGIVTLAWNFISLQAEDAARVAAEAAVAEANAKVTATQVELDAALATMSANAAEFDRLKVAIGNTNELVIEAERQIQELKLEAIDILSQVNTIRGSVTVMDGFAKVQRELNELRLKVERSEIALEQASSEGDDSGSGGQTLESLFSGGEPETPAEEDQ